MQQSLSTFCQIVIREHSIFSVVLTEAVAPYYVEAWRRASVNTLEKIECSLSNLVKKEIF